MPLRQASAVLRFCCARSLTLIACIFLSACGGGGGGGGGTGLSGNNQSPDPTAVEYPLAYVRRPQLAATAPVPDLRDPFAFAPGAQLFVRSRADANATETCITCVKFPGQENRYDVRDLDISPDGSKLIFALHPPLLDNVQPQDQTIWQLWQYEFANQQLTRVIISNNIAQLGNAVSPHYLADGRIVFVSDAQMGTRGNSISNLPPQPAYSGLVESRTRKAGVLHIMDGDGRNIRQISQNQSHDLFPWILQSGKILFSRWDNLGGTDRNLNLYTINPDGSELSALYGFYSHGGSNATNNLQFAQPREMEDGRIVAILRRFQTTSLGGDLIAIDANRYSDQNQPTWQNLGLAGTAQTSLAYNPITTDGTLSPGGQFGAAYPLWDGSSRLIVSWAQCFALSAQQQRVPCALAPAGSPPAPAEYGIWIYTPGPDATQRPVVLAQAGVIFTDIVAAAPRKHFSVGSTTTSAATDPVFSSASASLQLNNQGVLYIRSVNNLDDRDTSATIAAQSDPGSASYASRSARFLRLIEAVPLPDRQDPDPTPELDNFVFGRANFLRRIIGYVPIEPDGSVATKIPANIPFSFQIVNAAGMRINSTHEVWWQVAAGEVLRCGGCHSTTSQRTHGRLDSPPSDSNRGATLASNGGYIVSPLHDPTLKAIRSGQSMAEMYTLSRQLRAPSVNILFNDEWATNTAQQLPPLNFSYSVNGTSQVAVAPTTGNCLTTWFNECRIVINYLQHIQALWDKPRTLNGADATCISCHSATAPGGIFNAGQLDLTSGASDRDAERVMSWSELFVGDTQKDINGNEVLVDGPPILDAQGNPVLDANGNPTFTQIPVAVAPVLTTGALASPRFFGCFATGGTCGTVNGGANNNRHVGMLNAAELKLIAEWLDIGAQYYNNIADAANASK